MGRRIVATSTSQSFTSVDGVERGSRGDIEQLEEKLKQRNDFAEATRRLKDVERLLVGIEQPLRPAQHSTRGHWESQSTGGMQSPRHKR
jgi:hypothetical protein